MAFLGTSVSFMSLKYGHKKCFFSLILLCVFWLIISRNLQVKDLRPHPEPKIHNVFVLPKRIESNRTSGIDKAASHPMPGIYNDEPQADAIRITKKFSQQKFSKNHGEYVFALPKRYVSNRASGVDTATSHPQSGIDNDEPQVDAIRITKKFSQHNLSKNYGGYVFVLPKKIESNRASGIDINKEIHHLINILHSFHQYDGATCHGLEHNPSQDLQKLKSCWFKTRNWTMLISGPNSKNYHRHGEKYRPWIWICNIVEFPFLIRESIFNRIGLNQSHGEATQLDFFLRSNGTLKIAVSQKCVFTKNPSKIYQEIPETKRQVYMDYGLLGHTHNLLRIIRPDSIAWTKCSYKNTSCPDIPEQQTRADNILLPYCCKTLLNQILIHTVHAMNQIGIEYRVCFGTLLGAIRSKTIIPWTRDVDICLKTEDFKKRQTFEKLKEALKTSKYSYAYLRDKHRIVPLHAFVKHISNHSLVSESELFSEQTLRYMQELLPVLKPKWQRSPYADFYKNNKIFQRRKINVTIDGLEYSSRGKPHELLRKLFGSEYMLNNEKNRFHVVDI